MFEDRKETDLNRQKFNEEISSLFDDDDDDDFDEADIRSKSVSKKRRKRNKKEKQKRNSGKADYGFDDNRGGLFKRKNRDNYEDVSFDDDFDDDLPESKPRTSEFYDRDGNPIEVRTVKKPPQHVFLKVCITLVLTILGLGLWGYYNTDFDQNGVGYVVPLELYPKRAYMNKADDLLNYILSMDTTFDEDTYFLATDYATMYAKLNKEAAELKEKTNEFSRYPSVPSDFKGYHTDLINMSISIQECIKNLIKSYDDPEYESYREAVMIDYYKDLNNIKKMRQDYESDLFSNMPIGEEGKE